MFYQKSSVLLRLLKWGKYEKWKEQTLKRVNQGRQFCCVQHKITKENTHFKFALEVKVLSGHQLLADFIFHPLQVLRACDPHS